MTGRVVALRGLLDGARLFHVHGQRLLHHHGNVARRARFHDLDVGIGIGEGGDGFGLRGVEHLVEIRIKLIVGEVIRFSVLRQQLGIGVPNRDNDDIVCAVLRAAQKSGNVAVVQTGDGDPQRLFLGRLRVRAGHGDRGSDQRERQ